MNARAARTLRGLAAGSTATLVAAASHGLSGGTFPSLAGVALALAFSALLGIALAGRRMSVARLAASIGISQLAFHLFFSTIGGSAQVLAPTGHHGAVVIVGGTEVMNHASGAMWLAHGIAGALTLLAVVFGERSLVTLRASARMLLARLVSSIEALAPTTTCSRRSHPAVHLVPRTARELVDSCGLRGPPAAASVA